MRCPNCDTHYSNPLEVDDEIYEVVYRNASRIAGYDRYQEYAERVKRSDLPLDLLALSEDMYWFIDFYLKKHAGDRSLRILEVGSGLGYLTYSISRQGYQVRGMDISAQAVAQAQENYGDLFFQGDLFKHAEEHQGQYDIVLMTEVIEHVPDPLAFLDAAIRLTKEDGVVLVTTPNKSVFPQNALWDTDAPPIHFWWFSETSVRQMAIRTGTRIELCDFTRFNAPRMPGINKDRHSARVLGPVIDAAGEPIAPVSVSPRKKIARFFRRVLSDLAVLKTRLGLERVGSTRRTLASKSHLILSRSSSLGAVFSRPPSN